MDHTTPDAPNPHGRRDADRVAVHARTALTYVFDSRCPKCHAVTPTMIAAAEHRPDLQVDVIHGRLLPHPASLAADAGCPPDDASVRVSTEATVGGGFDAALDDGTAPADSDAAAAAFVAMRSIAPDLALDIAEAMHISLLIDGRDFTDVDTVLDLATAVGLSPDRVWAMLANPLVGRLAAVEQARAAAVDVESCPGLFVSVDDAGDVREVRVPTRLRTVDQVLAAVDAAVGRSGADDV